MRRKRFALFGIALLLLVGLLSGAYFIVEYKNAMREQDENTALEGAYASIVVEDDGGASALPVPEAPIEDVDMPEKPYLEADFPSLLETNGDTVGWICIPDTELSYPVVQADDNHTYLNKSFTGRRSGSGAIFMDMNNDAEYLDDNTVLYGHNMGYGQTTMFGLLLNYKDEEYYRAHRFIQFDTVYEDHGWWKIFAVINLQAGVSELDYMTYQFGTPDEFEDWILLAQSLSYYEADMTVNASDKILTLSTCDRSAGRGGRLIVMARKCR